MKTLFAILLFAFNFQTADKGAGTVWQEQGIYIFFYSRPVAAYDVLGSFKVKQAFTGEPKEQVKTALDKVHKDFPKADGIIFTDANMQQADVIKFK